MRLRFFQPVAKATKHLTHRKILFSIVIITGLFILIFPWITIFILLLFFFAHVVVSNQDQIWKDTVINTRDYRKY